MIDFYSWKTPNGQKIAIMLKETGLPFKVHWVDLTKQEQFDLAFLQLNPNNKIPVIVDRDGPDHHCLTLFESGAILIYLAEKTGQYLPTQLRRRMEAIQWLMFQVSGVGPMWGQLLHFLHYAAEKNIYAIERYTNEAKRLYRVIDNHLAQRTYFIDDYSIVDMAFFPWIHLYARQGIHLSEYDAIQRWYQMIANRPAVEQAMALAPPPGHQDEVSF
jgi:GSH-dependent disulfide-bond oxidoreductase